ncbi:MAG: hypothetical protein GVY13_11115 [Alphaproteobacteria bacterium]|jgi:hypothetical protein|nr:hypothetical protein [Alphaproteobacteria bacterium]
MPRLLRFRPTGLALLPLLLLVALVSPAGAQDALSIRAFAGTWEGVGVAENSDSLYFGVTTRDLNVRITPRDSGFEVYWTTLIRSGGTPEEPDVRRREASLTFRPTDDSRVFEAVGSENPLSGGVLSWARLHGNTLSVYQMTLNDRGGYELTSYDRALTGAGMEFVFRRIRDGEPVRTVEGRMVKTGG